MKPISNISPENLIALGHKAAATIEVDFPLESDVLRELATRFDLLREVHQQSAQSGWIKCKDRMPGECEVVVTSSAGHVQERLYYWMAKGKKVKNWFRAGTKSSGIDIEIFTHWMPLPADPMREHDNG